MKINLGCGIKGSLKDYINIDYCKCKGVDVVHNLNITPYPFKTNSVNKIYMAHTLEHLEINIQDFFKEIKRILKKNGKFTLIIPSECNMNDMFHKKSFKISNFVKYKKEDISNLEQYNLWKDWNVKIIKIRFMKCGKVWYFNRFVEWFVNKIRIDIYDNSCLKYLFPAHELEVLITKKNDM